MNACLYSFCLISGTIIQSTWMSGIDIDMRLVMESG